MDVSSQQSIPTEDLMKCIKYCREQEQLIISRAKVATSLIEHWSEDIKSKSETKRDVFWNRSIIEAPSLVFEQLLQDLDEKIDTVLELLKAVLVSLEWHIAQWKTKQLHETVGRRRERGPKDTANVEEMCEQVFSCVSALLGFAVGGDFQQVNSMRSQTLPMPTLLSRLEAVVQNLLNMCLVVIEQPELTMVTVKVKGEEDESNKSKKFRMVLGILGGKGFGGNLMITDVVIYLAYNQEIAEAQARNRKPQRTFKLDYELVSNNGRSGSPGLGFQKAFEYSAVVNFNREGISVAVYRQLYHVVFDVKIHVGQLMKEFQGRALSLPVMVRTASNQASEQVGALLWHSFSAKNVYDPKSVVAESMPVDDVVEMINERLSLPERPALTKDEREFLKERIAMAANGKSKKRARQPKSSGKVSITLYNFIKENVFLHGSSMGETYSAGFPIWRWLHSIVNLVHDTVRQAWLDGNIAGFLSRTQCERVLADKSIQNGTFLLRFSESKVTGNHLNCKGALAVAVKLKGKAAFPPPFVAERIEEMGLGYQIEACSHGLCRDVLGTHLTVSEVKDRYPPPKKADPTDKRYQRFITNRLKLESNQGQSQTVSSRWQQEGSDLGSGSGMPKIPLTVLAELMEGQQSQGVKETQFLPAEMRQEENMDVETDQHLVGPTHQVCTVDQSSLDQHQLSVIMATESTQAPAYPAVPLDTASSAVPANTMGSFAHVVSFTTPSSVGAAGVSASRPSVRSTSLSAVSTATALSSQHRVSSLASPAGVPAASLNAVSTNTALFSQNASCFTNPSGGFAVSSAFSSTPASPDGGCSNPARQNQAVAPSVDGYQAPMFFSTPPESSGVPGCFPNLAASDAMMGVEDPFMCGEEERSLFDSDGNLDWDAVLDFRDRSSAFGDTG